MAEDAVKLLTDRDFRRAMGKRARESAVARYRTDIVIPQYIEFYNQVIAEKGK
jgi:glycosyltransferase involved in cell wall biosynthesis